MNSPVSVTLSVVSSQELTWQKASQAANQGYVARLLSSQRSGNGCLPFYLGLAPADFEAMMRTCFANDPELLALASESSALALERGEMRQQLLDLRHDEWLELRDLLLVHRSGVNAMETSLAAIVAAGCLGGAHLWRDLGLVSRSQLSELMWHNFRGLAERNVQDMKWKRFFYKQLCEGQGSYVCRAPSCQQCAAFKDCFGPED
jgi:nitrogen fixation protein NifQ